MLRQTIVLTGLILLAAFAGPPPSAGQTDPGDSLGAPVALPPPPVAAVPEPEPAPAAEAPPLTAAPVYGAIADSLTVLVEYRPEADITRDLQNAVTLKDQAERRIEHVSMLSKLAESRIEIKASEIKALEAEISYAKSRKDEAKRDELEARKKFAGSEKELLERRYDLRQSDIQTARSVRAYQEATERACRLELDLAARRRECGRITSTIDPGAAAEYSRLQADILKLEGRVLEARIEQAGKLKELADHEVKLGKVRRAVYESQLKLAKGGR